MPIKIVLIGAGSAQFGYGTLGDIFQSDVLPGSHIVLHDINPDTLSAVESTGQQFIKEHELPFTISSTISRTDALQDADYCIISIEVGDRFKLWEQDWRIPQQFGIRQVYGENGGPGGLFHAMRIVPPILEICDDIEKICPEALVFNYSNPMSRICTTVHRKFPDLKFIGLCHEIPSLKQHLPTILNTPFENIAFKAGGLNHFSILLEATFKDTGKDAYPDIREKAPAYFEKLPELAEIVRQIKEAKNGPTPGSEPVLRPDAHPWADRRLFKIILEKFGYLPITTDSHFGEYIQWAHDVVDHKGILDFYHFYQNYLEDQTPNIELKVSERVIPIIEGIITDVGTQGSHTGVVRVELADPDIREKIMSTGEFTDRWRQATGEVVGVEYLKFAADAGGPGSRGRALAVELSHRNVDVLESACTELAGIVATYPRVKDVDDGFLPGKQQLDFAIKPEGKSLGLSAQDIARQVRSAFYGTEVLRQQRGRNEIKIMVRLPESQRSSEHTIDELMIRTRAGIFVPLAELATARRGRAYTSISRRNGRRVIEVSADITPRSKAGEVLTDLKADTLPQLVRDYRGLQYSFEGHQADMRESMGSLKVTFALAMLAIYAMLAIPFRSYVQPLIVMVSIPFGVIGAFIGHLVMGYDLCIPSMFGIVALSGVVVNDSLVMIDLANRRRNHTGMSHHDAIHSAAIQRFRPILLTTVTTFGGLAPMIFETSRQARFLIPMALSLGFGLLFATFITLLIVPSLYMAAEDAKRALSRAARFLCPSISQSGDHLLDRTV